MVREIVFTSKRKAELYLALKKEAGENPSKLHTREELAGLTGKYRLSPNDIRHLEDLVDEGYIERGSVERKKAIGGTVLAYRYIHKDDETGAQG